MGGRAVPGHRSYLDIYDHYGLLRPRAVYGHCIHLDDEDRRRMADTRTVVALPTSNFFLGSGLFDFDKACEFDVPVTLATDVGGGTSFSMLQTMNEAHKVARLSGHHLTATRMFWLATAGAAQALDLADTVGTLAPRRSRFHHARPGPRRCSRAARAIARGAAVRVRAARRRSRGVPHLRGRPARARARRRRAGRRLT
jgi:hypothetical protein